MSLFVYPARQSGLLVVGDPLDEGDIQEPVPFSLGDPITNANLSTLYEADSFVVQGLTEGIFSYVFVSNGIYTINNIGEAVSTPGIVENGDVIRFWVRSSSEPVTEVEGSVTIAGFTAKFSVTTSSISLWQDEDYGDDEDWVDWR